MPARKTTKEAIVRMYRQGLGDCFLITLPRAARPFHLLIDCGALNSKHYNAALMQQVVRDIKKQSGGRLDAVAGTHEHWDHISGFLQAAEIFAEMIVGEVWVAWTEEPHNEAAQALKKEFKKRKQAVEMALARIPDDKHDAQLGLYKKAIIELFGFFGGLGASDDAGPTEQAWKNMLGLSREKVYCDPQKRPLEIDGVAGVRIYVLGPPQDPDYIRKKLSKKETYDESDHAFSLFDSFHAAVADHDDINEQHSRALPFDKRYRRSAAEAKGMEFFREHYGFAPGTDEWRRIDDDWLTLAGELALHLDSYTNNTCLALAIELGEAGPVLLFPGDAQVGNWLSWADRSWQVKKADGTMRTVTSDDLLARTVLYKVGHHGSHNATLRAKGLELMEHPELVAMIPVHRPTAQDQHWEFPHQPLWDRLKERACGRVLLADAADLSEIEQEASERLSASKWRSFKKATKFTELYVEHRIAY